MSRPIVSIAKFLHPLRRRILKLFRPAIVSGDATLYMTSPRTIYDYSIPGIDGNEIRFENFRGRKLLLVNTASECGYTPQYAPLQELHEKYGGKLVVIGFPSNNFGAQEPGSEADILNFCQRNYGVTFPLSVKIDVAGDHKHEVFRWLTTKELNGWNDRDPNWNFCKYLVDENGRLVNFFSHKLDPMDPQLLEIINLPPQTS